MWCGDCRFDVLHEVASAGNQDGGPEAALQIVQQLLSETLFVLHELLMGASPTLVLPLTQVCCYLWIGASAVPSSLLALWTVVRQCC